MYVTLRCAVWCATRCGGYVALWCRTSTRNMRAHSQLNAAQSESCLLYLHICI